MKQNFDLKQLFTEIKGYEKQARDFYASLNKQLSDKAVKKAIEGIRLDEEKHMEIAEGLKALSGAKTTAEVKKTLSKVSIGFDSNDSFLLVSPTKDYLKNLIGLFGFLEKREASLLVVSVNKSKQDLLKAMEKMDAEAKNIRIIDSASGGLNPKDLTSLEISLVKELEKTGYKAVLFDSISFLSMFHSANTLKNFSRSMISVAKKHGLKIVLSLVEEESDKALVASLASMVDETVQSRGL